MITRDTCGKGLDTRNPINLLKFYIKHLVYVHVLFHSVNSYFMTITGKVQK